MGWADNYIEKLRAGEIIQFRPRGDSMRPRIKSGELVTVAPLERAPEVGDVVLCTVSGAQYLHLVRAQKVIRSSQRFQITNMRGGVNGWIKAGRVHGKVTAIEP